MIHHKKLLLLLHKHVQFNAILAVFGLEICNFLFIHLCAAFSANWRLLFFFSWSLMKTSKVERNKMEFYVHIWEHCGSYSLYFSINSNTRRRFFSSVAGETFTFVLFIYGIVFFFCAEGEMRGIFSYRYIYAMLFETICVGKYFVCEWWWWWMAVDCDPARVYLHFKLTHTHMNLI